MSRHPVVVDGWCYGLDDTAPIRTTFLLSFQQFTPILAVLQDKYSISISPEGNGGSQTHHLVN